MTPDEVDHLFEVDPGDFVRERDALARRLKDEGRADDAAEVRRLRRPSTAVWALNQLARRRPEEVAGLLAAGEQVREAQHQRAGTRLREASRDVHARASRLASATAVLARGVRETEVEAALRSAALAGDPDGALRAGRLQSLPEAPLGPEMWTAGAAEVEPEPELQMAAAEDDARRQKLDAARARHDKAQAEVDRTRVRVGELEQQLAAERASLDDARSRLAHARREVERLQRRR